MNWSRETGVWISRRLCGSLSGYFRRYEVCHNLVDFAKDADCLIHAAWSAGRKNSTPPSKRSVASAEDAGRVFAIVKPKLGVVYHYKDEEGLEGAVRKEYKGRFAIARDLINAGETVTWDGRSSANATSDGDKSRR
jgi:hypothetical protein